MSKFILAKEKKRERGPQMKRSPPSSSSCSSSASSKETLPPHPPLQPTKSKTKRTRRNLNPKKPQFGYSSGRRSSVYRGVTRHRWTGRYEAHLWDKNSWNPVQTKKGRQVYLGAYDDEEAAAHTYDLAALKYWGPDTILNFPLITYAKEFKEMQNVSKEEYLATLRRRSSGFSRGVSKYRGVARHHHNGRWEARIGRVFGNKYLYLGTYSTQEEAAEAYDRAAIRYRGLNAVTNFDISHYTNNQLLQPLQQQQQQTTIQFSTEAQESSAASQITSPELPVSVDHHHQATVMDAMDEHPWSLHMDSEFNPLPVPDIAFDKSSELPDLFDGNGFEDDIDFLFDSSKENGISLDGIFENSGGFEGDLLRDVEEQGLMGESLSSSTSSSSVQYPYPITICS